VWLRRLLKDIGSEQAEPTVIYEDTQGTIALAKNVGNQARTKHIDIRYHFIREKVASGEIELVYMKSKNPLADYLTKGLSTKTLCYLMMTSNVGPEPMGRAATISIETPRSVGIQSGVSGFLMFTA
jgi:hypothetical protein